MKWKMPVIKVHYYEFDVKNERLHKIFTHTFITSYSKNKNKTEQIIGTALAGTLKVQFVSWLQQY